MADHASTQAPARAGEDSTAELVKNLSEQVSRLIRDELKLAEYEMARKARRMRAGAGMFGGSGLAAFYGVGCLLAAAITGMAVVLPAWLAGLLVGLAVLAVAGLLALLGRGQLGRATPPVPEQAARSMKADVEEIKERAHR